MIRQNASGCLWPRPQPSEVVPPRAEAFAPIGELWLALHLPALPLEIFPDDGATRPIVVCDSDKSVTRVIAANESARCAGVRAGMPINAAFTLTAHLQVHLRNPDAERRCLESLALRIGRYTPRVSLSHPQTLLLEVAGSLRLFGGLENLLHDIRRTIGGLGYRYRLAGAPNPLAAALLARAGRDDVVTERSRLGSVLHGLPIGVLNLAANQHLTLRRMGIECLGELVRLPRDGLARRLSPALPAYLDRLTGRQADPQPVFVPPARFTAGLDLIVETVETEMLLRGAGILLHRLEDILQQRCAAIHALRWRFAHPAAPPTVLAIRLVAPCRQAAHLLEQTTERLEHLVFPEPVRRIELETAPLQPAAEVSLTWIADRDRSSDENRHLFLDRLKARLGDAAVQGMCLVAEHRPEKAWRGCPPGQHGPALHFGRHFGQRPLWLLPEPALLPVRDGRPYLKSRLRFKKQRERIASGWWDETPAARDYFTARNADGARLWIFRELDSGAWYIHGIYG